MGGHGTTRMRVCGGLGRRRAEPLGDLDMNSAQRPWSEKGAGRAMPGPLPGLLLVLVAGGVVQFVDRAEAAGEGRIEGLRHPANFPPSIGTWSDSDGAKGLPLLDGGERALMRAVRRADSVTAFYVELTLALTMPVQPRPKSSFDNPNVSQRPPVQMRFFWTIGILHAGGWFNFGKRAAVFYFLMVCTYKYPGRVSRHGQKVLS